MRCRFYAFHELLFRLSARGIGVLNYENDDVSGERTFVRSATSWFRAPTVLDVGAHAGRFSAHVKSVCSAARVFAFEPNPSVFQVLEARARASGFTAINQACGQEPGQLELFDQLHEGNGSELASVYREAIEDLLGERSRSIVVPVTSIDQFMESHGLRHVHILKIDTEGHEFAVLRGASNALKTGHIDVIHFEFNAMNVLSRVYYRDFRKLLSDYDLYRVLPDGLAPLRDYDPLVCEVFAFQNLVAIRVGCGIRGTRERRGRRCEDGEARVLAAK